MSVRASVKSLVEQGARWSGANRWSRWRRRHDVVILAYHNIIPHSERMTGDRSLHLPQRAFAAQLDQLLETHDVVPLATILAEPQISAEQASLRPRAVITFDDAYRGAVTAGVAELQVRHLPATIFIAPHFVGGGTFWWDMLAGPDGLDPALREHALIACAGRQDAILGWASARGASIQDVPSYMACVDEAELHAALAHPGISFGSHTWSHPNLAQLDGDLLRHELAAPREWLARFGARVVDAITYPYGQTNERTRHEARAAGYQAGYLIDGGWLTPHALAASHGDAAAFAIPRLNVAAGLSAGGFAMRVAGTRIG